MNEKPRKSENSSKQELSFKATFDDLVKRLATHGQEEKKTYGASYKLGIGRTLTVLHHAAYEDKTTDKFMAFLVEKVEVDNYTIRVRESYFSKPDGIHYGISISGFTDPKGKHTVIRDEKGRPDHIYLEGGDIIPPEAKLALLEKCVKEKHLSKLDKIAKLLEIMEEVNVSTRRNPRRDHFDEHGEKNILDSR